jgi:hypothetical protein
MANWANRVVALGEVLRHSLNEANFTTNKQFGEEPSVDTGF